MPYSAPVWIDAMEKKWNKTTYGRVQRLMNIKIAKAYCMTSNEALCILTGTTPIDIKAEETAKLYHMTRADKIINWAMTQSQRIGYTRQTQSESTSGPKKRNT
jgi:heptaprenylglyceryl phosphate synthase